MCISPTEFPGRLLGGSKVTCVSMSQGYIQLWVVAAVSELLNFEACLSEKTTDWLFKWV